MKSVADRRRALWWPAGRRVRAGVLAWLILAATALLAVGVSAWAVLPPLFAPLAVNVAGGTVELLPEAQIGLTIGRGHTGIVDVQLREQQLDGEGRVVAERSVPVELAPAASTDNRQDAFQLARADGSPLLKYDSLYQLEVTTSRKEMAWPLPVDVVERQTKEFSTATTPHLRLPTDTVQLNHQQPVELRWTAPLQALTVVAEPQLEVRTQLDPASPNVARVELVGAQPGTRYTLNVLEATSAAGRPLLRPVQMTVETPPVPQPLLGEVKLTGGNSVVVPWDTPIRSLIYTVTPAVQSEVVIDSANGQTATIVLQGATQGQEYEVTLAGAVSDRNVPLAQPQTFTVTTPNALVVTQARPRHNSFGVSLKAPITITFSEPVQDREAAQRAIKFTPAMEGRFEWTEPNRLSFTPHEGMPQLTNVRIDVQGGPTGVRGAGDGFLDESFDWSFRTQPDKLIEVNLSNQTMYLHEGGNVVRAIRVATGVTRAETPTGSYMVTYRAPQLRMRGTNPSGISYDIPDVPWVLVFWGDYTIHGAPWRSSFGFPQSNGCVSMATSDSKVVYDWAPLGTPITIHY
ncbi:MAG: L,D-transpeptidase family protein [Chloroflexota bacterium]